MWLSLELGICLKPHFRRHAGAHTYTEVHMSMQHSGFNAAALGPLIYFFTQASSPAFNSTCFYLERVAGPFKLIRKQQNQMNSIYFSLINCMAIWPGWKACTLDSLLQGPEAEPINRSPSLVGTCSLLTTVSVLSLPRLLLINMPDPYHFVLRQVWQPFRLYALMWDIHSPQIWSSETQFPQRNVHLQNLQWLCWSLTSSAWTECERLIKWTALHKCNSD